MKAVLWFIYYGFAGSVSIIRGFDNPKLLYPSNRVRTVPPISVRVRARVSVSFSFTNLCFEIDIEINY